MLTFPSSSSSIKDHHIDLITDILFNYFLSITAIFKKHMWLALWQWTKTSIATLAFI